MKIGILSGIVCCFGWLASARADAELMVRHVYSVMASTDSILEPSTSLKITTRKPDFQLTVPDANRSGSVMVILPFQPSFLKIKVLHSKSGLSQEATVLITSLKTGKTRPYIFVGEPLEMQLEQADEVIVKVIESGFEPVSKQFKIEVPPAGREYELSVRLKPFQSEQTARFIDAQPLAAAPVRPSEPFAKPLSAVVTTKAFGAIERGKSIPLSHLYFDQSSPVLRPQSFAELDQLAQVLRENPAMRIQLRGYTDNVGDFDLNVKLAQGRCQSVVDYLVTKGIERGRLESVGRGPLDPVAPNNTEENRRKNRRVEFVVL